MLPVKQLSFPLVLLLMYRLWKILLSRVWFVKEKYDIIQLKDLIQQHVDATGSEKGKRILDNFEEYLPKFKKIIPHDYERVLKTIVQMEEKGLSAEQAQIEAFYANTRK